MSARTHRPRRRPTRAARPRSGFTLVELMVGLSLGAVVLMSVYTIGIASARHFQEQQRISQLQLATRLALDRIRRDVSLAGFGGTPSSTAERSSGGGGAGVGPIVGVAITDHDPGGMAALGTLPGSSEAGVHADALRMVGNFDTSDIYLVRDYAGGTLNLQTNWQGYRRSFMATTDGTEIDAALFAQVFAPGRVVHVVHPTAGHHFAVISSATADPSGSYATVEIGAGLPASVDVCLGCLVAPLSGVQYSLAAASGPFVAPNPAITGANTVLVRQEFSLETGALIAGTQRTILEWAIDFDVDVFVDTAPIGAPPILTFFDDALAGANAAASPGSIRSLVVSVSARTPEQDHRFPFVARTAGAPLTRFRPDTSPDHEGACRVRTARAEILLPSIAYRGLR